MKASEVIIERMMESFDVPECSKEIVRERFNNLGHALIEEFLHDQGKEKVQEKHFLKQ